MDAQQKSKLQKMAIVPLAGVFALVLFNSLKSAGLIGGGTPAPAAPVSSAAPASAASRPAAASSTASASSTAPQAEGGSLMAYTAEADGIRNPFVDLLPSDQPAPAQADEVPAPAPVVWPAVSIQGIIWGHTDRRVIIDGRIYRVGDTVQGMTIVSIVRDGVTVEMQGATTQLTVSRSSSDILSSQGGQATGLISPYPPSRFPGGDR